MSSTPKYRLPASAIEADREALLALQELTDYRPVNPEHTVEPGTWERQGWRRRLRQPLHPSGMARLAQRLAR